MQAHPTFTALWIAITASALGCSDPGNDGTAPGSVPSFAGQWSGVASFPGPRSTNATLTQSGRLVAGNMMMEGMLPGSGRQLNGQIDDLDRLVWIVLDACRMFSGTLSQAQGGHSMSGPININDSGCPTNSSASATLTLNRLGS